VQREGSMLTLFFAPGRLANLKAVQAANQNRFAEFFTALLGHGVHLPPSGYEAWFVSLAHDDAAIQQTLEAVSAALRSL